MKFFAQYQKLESYIKEILDDSTESFRFPIKKEKEDRFKKIDAHIIWAIVFHESSKYLGEDNHILTFISEYYSIFHCSFSYMLIDMSIDDQKFERIRHSQLLKMLNDHLNRNLITKNYIDLFNDTKIIREYINYLGEKDGLQKFIALRRGQSFIRSTCYGDVTLHQLKDYILEDIDQLLEEYIKILKYLENIAGNKYLFGVLHIDSDFDYYGEDFLEGFLVDGELKDNIMNYLRDVDETIEESKVSKFSKNIDLRKFDISGHDDLLTLIQMLMHFAFIRKPSSESRIK